MNFEWTVTLGQLLHAAIMVFTISQVARHAFRQMDRIEKKQDKLIQGMNLQSA